MKLNGDSARQFVFFSSMAYLGYLLGNQDSTVSALTNIGISAGTANFVGKICESAVNNGYDKISEFLQKKFMGEVKANTENINATMAIAFEKAVDKIRIEYENIRSIRKRDDGEAVICFLNDLVQCFKEAIKTQQQQSIDKEHIKEFLSSSAHERKMQLFEKLNLGDKLQHINEQLELQLKDKLSEYYWDAFIQELQTPGEKREPAWREYQMLQYELILDYAKDSRIEHAEIDAILLELNEKLAQQNIATNQAFIGFKNSLADIQINTDLIPGIHRNLNEVLHSLRLGRLQLFQEITKHLRNEYRQSNPLKPSYDTFIKREICIPQAMQSEIEFYINDNQDLIILGAPASGKTILGTQIAYEWSIENGSPCFFFDMKKLSGLSDANIKANIDLENIVGKLPDQDMPILFVLDNAHVDMDFATCFKALIMEFRDNGFNVSILFLCRKLQNEMYGDNTLQDDTSIHTINLQVNAESIECVARWLYKRAGIEPVLNPELTESWLRASGSDLLIFTLAFDPANPRNLNDKSISDIAYTNYLKRAEEQNPEISQFLDLCNINSLDLEFCFTRYWKVVSFRTIYPDFYNERIIEPAENARDTYCHLFHPNLAKLLLKVYRRYNQYDAPVRMAELCTINPLQLRAVLIRLNTGLYWTIEDRNLFANAISKYPELIKDSIMQNPTLFEECARAGIQFDLYTLKETEPDSYKNFVHNLARSSLSHWEKILKAIQASCEQYLYSNILQLVVEDSEAWTMHVQKNLGHIAKTLKFLSESPVKAKVPALLKSIIEDPYFVNTLANTSVFNIMCFLDFLKTTEFRDREGKFWQALLADINFQSKLLKYTGGELVKFFESAAVIDSDWVSTQLKSLVDNPKFPLALAEATPVHAFCFIGYLEKTEFREKAPELLQVIMGNRCFIQTLESSTPPTITAVLEFLVGNAECDEYLNRVRDIAITPRHLALVVNRPISEICKFFELMLKLEEGKTVLEVLKLTLRSSTFPTKLFETPYLQNLIPFVKAIVQWSKPLAIVYFRHIFMIVDHNWVLATFRYKTINKNEEPETTAHLLAEIKKYKIMFPEDFYNALVQFSGERYNPVVPDEEYSKVWFGKNIDDVIFDLKFQINARTEVNNRHKANCYVASMQEDMGRFEEWLKKHKSEDIEKLKEYTRKSELIGLMQYFFPNQGTEEIEDPFD